MELVLVRNGEDEHSSKGIYSGFSNPLLTLRGIEQAEDAAKKLSNIKFSAIYSSPLTRAKDSADYIKKVIKAPIVLHEGLKEQDFGIFEGHTTKQIKEKYKTECAEWEKDWLNYEIPKGESFFLANARNVEAINYILNRHEGENICVISHLGVIRNILAFLLGVDFETSWKIRIHSGGIVKLEINDGYTVLTALNI